MTAPTSASVPSFEQPEPRRISAPYGQACYYCVKAKCRCIIISTNSSFSKSDSRLPCERCARLGRECKPTRGVRKLEGAGTRRRAGASAARASSGLSSATRAANLEQRLEDLMEMLKAQTAGTSTDSAYKSGSAEPFRRGKLTQNVRVEPEVPMYQEINQHPNNIASKITPCQQPMSSSVAAPANPTGSRAPTSAPTSSLLPDNDVLMPPIQAAEALDFFRQYYLKFFPFVYIPSEMDAAQLQHERPFLWLAICAVCCKSQVKQAALSRRILEELAHRMLITCERSIDMLLGTLCALGWTMCLCLKPILSSMMSMATSIVTDLRLDKPEYDHSSVYCFKSNDFVTHPQSTSRTMEERRATLACYVYCSSGASLLRCQSMRWTSHMEDSLKLLAENPECEGDQILVLMVQIRKLTESLVQAHATWASECDISGTFRPSINIYIKYFLQGLQSIKDSMPQNLWDNRLATSLIMSAEVTITDLPFYNPTHSGYMLDLHTRPGAQSDFRQIDIGRVEASFAVLQTTATFLKHFLTFELPDLLGFSFPVLLSFFRALQILYRLRLLDCPGWDHSAVSESIDMLAVVDLMANRYGQLSNLYGFLAETDADDNEVTNFYVKCSKMLRATLSVWRAHFGPSEVSKTDTAVNVSGDSDPSDEATRSQVPPAMMGEPGLNSNIENRENYSPINNNVILPEPFPTEFQLDDAWYNEMLFSWDPNVSGPVQ
ncbi:hypothetical protein GGS21DRAFT_509197 [Xylaria nigripes]|nr:hypothetical protein GGS21DRAFT_509197 [Xylaria nigripes]